MATYPSTLRPEQACIWRARLAHSHPRERHPGQPRPHQHHEWHHDGLLLVLAGVAVLLLAFWAGAS